MFFNSWKIFLCKQRHQYDLNQRKDKKNNRKMRIVKVKNGFSFFFCYSSL